MIVGSNPTGSTRAYFTVYNETPIERNKMSEPVISNKQLAKSFGMFVGSIALKWWIIRGLSKTMERAVREEREKTNTPS